MTKRLIWTFAWLIYSTAILYIALETQWQIHSKEITGLIAFFWIIAPVGAYFTVNGKQSNQQPHDSTKKDKDQ